MSFFSNLFGGGQAARPAKRAKLNGDGLSDMGDSTGEPVARLVLDEDDDGEEMFGINGSLMETEPTVDTDDIMDDELDPRLIEAAVAQGRAPVPNLKDEPLQIEEHVEYELAQKPKRSVGRPRKYRPDEEINHSEMPIELLLGERRLSEQEQILDSQFSVIKNIILSKLTGRRRVPIVGMVEEQKALTQMLVQTITAGEGNSMLVIGARGTGKTTLVETVLEDIKMEHSEHYHVIRLNGFIHTDDKLALREIWRQLGKEMEIDDGSTDRAINYSDTLATLLALLSHPAELALVEPERAAKSVVFVLDEFDLFATHPRQTLLYNLFDVAQARKAPVLVLGITSRIDVVESLEKRVKSRFSHRYVHLSLPKHLNEFWSICKAGLQLYDHELTLDERMKLEDHSFYRLLSTWNENIQGLGDDETFKLGLQRIYYRSKSVADFFTAALSAVHAARFDRLELCGELFALNQFAAPDSKLALLSDLSELELELLICAARLDEYLDVDTVNFNMVYEEYITLASQLKVQAAASGATAIGSAARIWSRDVSRGAWERLAEWGLLLPVTTTAGVGARDSRMFRADVALKEIAPSVKNLATGWQKFCRTIDPVG